MGVARSSAWWYAPMAVTGAAFGLLGDRRPFGGDVLAHPFVVYFALVAAALLIVRIAGGRPVPHLLPDRALLLGCLVGAAAFLAGNGLAAHVLPR
ncbi:MAG: hypothetical protein IT537_19580 [Hyphomicrobiales bacterium]|nr:hypothetical protein [Hyphomicrobiales bacterium]